MKIEVLYFGGCPNHKPAVEQVRIALRFAGVDAPIEEVEVEDPAMAQKIGFLGSPSIRVDGLDVEPEARTLKEFSFSCRTYSSNGRRLGLPSIELIRKAVIEASISEALVESRGA